LVVPMSSSNNSITTTSFNRRGNNSNTSSNSRQQRMKDKADEAVRRLRMKQQSTAGCWLGLFATSTCILVSVTDKDVIK
jgi:hypothetical protein